MRHRKLLKKLNSSDGVFVDVNNVNSFVRYSLETSLYDDGSSTFDGAVSFGDCNRSVCWHTDYSSGDLTQKTFLSKIDKAIDLLRQARNAIIMQSCAADEHEKRIGKRKGKKK